MRVTFERVGRSKRTWTVELPSFDWSAMVREIRRSGALMSRDIDVTDADVNGRGSILAGMHLVGHYQLENTP